MYIVDTKDLEREIVMYIEELTGLEFKDKYQEKYWYCFQFKPANDNVINITTDFLKRIESDNCKVVPLNETAPYGEYENIITVKIKKANARNIKITAYQILGKLLEDK